MPPADRPAPDPSEPARPHPAAARRHAVLVERLAVVLATFWVVTTTYVALGDVAAFAVTWAVVVTLALASWAALRSMALALHLQADAAEARAAHRPADGPPDA